MKERNKILRKLKTAIFSPIFSSSCFSNLRGNLGPILQIGNQPVFLVGTQHRSFKGKELNRSKQYPYTIQWYQSMVMPPGQQHRQKTPKPHRYQLLTIKMATGIGSHDLGQNVHATGIHKRTPTEQNGQ